MRCDKCGRLTFFKKVCESCEQNESLFQGLPAGTISTALAAAKMQSEQTH
jgi:hypothetical protein